MKYLFSALFALLMFVHPQFAAAETINCTNITSVPTTISTQGVYCLKQDLATAISAGNAITVQTNNVTIDCNGYKIGGLAAGLSTNATGIYAMQRNNITIRNCIIRGFWMGISLSYDGVPDPIRPIGHIIENNRIDLSTRLGINVSGDASIVRNNIISGTGGNTGGDNAIGIQTFFNADVMDNTIDGVSDLSAAPKQVYGIISWYSEGNVFAGNRIRGLSSAAGTNGIETTFESLRASVRGNTVVNKSGPGLGIACVSDTVIASDNHVNGFDTGVSGCATVSANNAVAP